MTSNELLNWERLFVAKIASVANGEDPAHDILHFQRVVALAKRIGAAEGGDPAVTVPAAWLHDLVIVPKSSPLRSKASRLSAESAVAFLRSINYPPQYHEAIAHAIEGHSFSAQIEARSIEAKIVQDADRLDGLGAIGLARCFATAGLLRRSFYSETEPFCEGRTPDDTKYTIDHFFTKLFKTVETLQTETGRCEGRRRATVMREFLSALRSELKAD